MLHLGVVFGPGDWRPPTIVMRDRVSKRLSVGSARCHVRCRRAVALGFALGITFFTLFRKRFITPALLRTNRSAENVTRPSRLSSFDRPVLTLRPKMLHRVRTKSLSPFVPFFAPTGRARFRRPFGRGRAEDGRRETRRIPGSQSSGVVREGIDHQASFFALAVLVLVGSRGWHPAISGIVPDRVRRFLLV